MPGGGTHAAAPVHLEPATPAQNRLRVFKAAAKKKKSGASVLGWETQASTAHG